jgi:hypothetical protein
VGRIDLQGKENYMPGREKKLLSGSRLDYYESLAFPLFYGLAMPLLKGGFPVRPVQLENITRYPGYLDRYKLLVLSYEFQKPQTADINAALATYVLDGGTLVYVGDGQDPFHKIRAWWNTGKNSDRSPLEYLLRLLGIDEHAPTGEYACGKGTFMLLRESPADYCTEAEKGLAYAETVGGLAGMKPDANYISLRRGEFIITAVMDESVSDAPITHTGLFADMLDNDFAVITEKTVRPGEYAVLTDLKRITENPAVIGTSIRINELCANGDGFRLSGCGATCEARIRLKLPRPPRSVLCASTPAETAGGPEPTPIDCEWDEKSGTALLRFTNRAGKTEIIINN